MLKGLERHGFKHASEFGITDPQDWRKHVERVMDSTTTGAVVPGRNGSVRIMMSDPPSRSVVIANTSVPDLSTIFVRNKPEKYVENQRKIAGGKSIDPPQLRRRAGVQSIANEKTSSARIVPEKTPKQLSETSLLQSATRAQSRPVPQNAKSQNPAVKTTSPNRSVSDAKMPSPKPPVPAPKPRSAPVPPKQASTMPTKSPPTPPLPKAVPPVKPPVQKPPGPRR